MNTKPLLFASPALLVSCAALTAAADPENDPRRTYSTDGWELVWADDFDGDDPFGYLANWRHEVGFVRNQEPQFYTSNRVENCVQRDGVLTITARRETWPNPRYAERALGGWQREREFANYTSASLQSNRAFHYGRIEFRAQLPGGWGAWPALWFLGECRRKPAGDPERFTWPACGEIDLVEIWGCNPTRVATCLHTAHRGPEPGETYVAKDFHVMKGRGEYNATAPGSEPWNGFHTYTLDWYEDRLYTFYDGHLISDADLSQCDWADGQNPFRKPMSAIMNLALGGWKNPVVEVDTVDEKTGQTIPAIKLPMEMKIDWVRYYKPAAN